MIRRPPFREYLRVRAPVFYGKYLRVREYGVRKLLPP